MEGKAVERDTPLNRDQWLTAALTKKSRHRVPRFWWRCITLLIVVMLVCSGVFGTIQPVGAVSTTVVISQFQIAGTNAADEFIELHNVSGSSVDLNGFTLVYRSAAGTSDVTLFSWSTITTVPAGGYFLVGATPGYDGSPTADSTYADGTNGKLSGTSGGLAIRNGAANTGTIVDSVGYGSATNIFVETANAAVPTANNSGTRKTGGCLDGDNNSTDFEALAPSVPRNSSTTPVLCGAPPVDNPPTVTTTSPTNGATNVVPSANITVTFSESVTLTDLTGNRPFNIDCGGNA